MSVGKLVSSVKYSNPDIMSELRQQKQGSYSKKELVGFWPDDI